MLENYFNYKKHKTDFKTEVIAGTTTFLTMAYIMFLNPFILSGEFAGPEKGFFDFGAVYTATILATALACFIMAFYGKTWPIGLAPGMGINAFVAMALERANVENRKSAIQDAIFDYFETGLIRHGFKGDRDAMWSILKLDVNLNAQGIEVWLEKHG